MGSGSLAAMAILESGFKDDMELEEARDLVRDAIRAGIFNDLGSGGNVDLRIIHLDGSTDYLRNHETNNEGSVLRAQVVRPGGPGAPVFAQGTTPVLAKTEYTVPATAAEGAVAPSIFDLIEVTETTFEAAAGAAASK
jgi:20S proteasome subunit beta 2|tara:strand:- start:123 stop:536 length:414 start_codon:yes stop_codon:yes gene_type:complete